MKDNSGLMPILLIGVGAFIIWEYVIPAMQQSAAQSVISNNVANLSTQLAAAAPTPTIQS